jgi:hypothetical protein
LSTSAGWGARPGRSTTANLEAVTHSIAQSLQQTKCAAIATYDLEDAYNKVDIRILADKLTNLLRLIVTLLGSRTCQMKYGKWRSPIFTVSSGLPQGSQLSAVLFNVYTYDILERLQ